MQLSKRQLAYLLQQQFNAPTLDQYIRSLAPAAWFRMDQGVTVTGARISQVDDLSGNARHLLDPGTTRPIYLPYSGTKYLYLPGASGNYASTPDSVANSITGDIDIRVRVALDDWSPVGNNTLIAKFTNGGAPRSFLFRVAGVTGRLDFFWTEDGSTTKQEASSVAPTVSDGDFLWLRVTMDVDNGAGDAEVKFWTSADATNDPDAVSWTQLGTTQLVGATTSIADTNAEVSVGALAAGLGSMFGKIYRAIVKNGIDGTTVVDFNPADASDGATSFASSATGETWTVNSSGALPAQIVGRASALFNGTSHYLKCNAFTLNQPTTVLLVMKQVSWTADDRFCDGDSNLSLVIYQKTGTPRVGIYAGAAGPDSTSLAIGATGILTAVFNGTSSSFGVNSAAAAAGNAGVANAGGFTLGASAAATVPSNIQVYEAVIFPIAPSTAQLDRLIAGLMARHGMA